MNRRTIPDNFLIGQTTSGSISLNAGMLTGITITGSKVTGTSITFTVSQDGSNFYPLYDSDSTEVSLTVTTAARSYNVEPRIFIGWPWVKARLGNSASAVAQATANQEILFHVELD